MISLSRSHRRRLERRKDELVRGLRDTPFAVDPSTSLRDVCVLLTDGVPALLVTRENIPPALRIAGYHMVGLAEVLAEVAADPRDDGSHVPVLALLSGWLQVTFVHATWVTRGAGGDA